MNFYLVHLIRDVIVDRKNERAQPMRIQVDFLGALL